MSSNVEIKLFFCIVTYWTFVALFVTYCIINFCILLMENIFQGIKTF